MIETLVRSEQGKAHGMFRFSVLPRPGDRISLAGEVLAVVYVMHNPVEVPSSCLANPKPVATVVVERLGGSERQL